MAISENNLKGAALGIMGGTYNPVHNGHLHAATAFAEAFNLPQLHLMPCCQPVHKELPIASAEQRLAMLNIALANHAKLSVDDRELKRVGASYTIDSLQEIRSEIGSESRLYFALGTDAFASLTSWKHWQELFVYANFVILHRPGAALSINSEFLQRRFLKKHSEHPAAGALFDLSINALDISSTQIRYAINQQTPLTGLMPEAIRNYIEQQHLY